MSHLKNRKGFLSALAVGSMGVLLILAATPSRIAQGRSAAQSQVSQPQASAQDEDAIDGAKNPEQIPDFVAYRLYFLVLTERDASLSAPSERQRAFLSSAGLSDAEIEVAARILKSFKMRNDELVETYNKAIVLTNDSSADRALFVSKREALIQATRDAFNTMLSAKAVDTFNKRAMFERGKMLASKSDIQQVVAIRSKPTNFLPVSMKSPQYGGCTGAMTEHYSAYTTYATNSLGKNIYASTEVEGTTGQGNSSYCYGNITHQPHQYLTVGTAGGRQLGQPVTPPAQINVFEDVTLLCDACIAEVPIVVQDEVWCSSVGPIFNFIGPSGFIRISTTNYLYQGTVGTICTYKLSCPNGTYNSCGAATVTAPTPCGYNFLIFYFLVFRVGTNSTCFPVGLSHYSSTSVPCS